MIKIPYLFKHDANGLAIPELNDDMEWVRKDEGEMTYMLDGQCLRCEGAGQARKWYKRHKGSDGLTYWIELNRESEKDKDLWECIDFDKFCSPGIFEAIGSKINGNPHGLEKAMMYRIIPVEWKLVQRTGHIVKRGYDITVQQLFDSLKVELSDPSCDVEGVVFHKESWAKGACTLVAAAKVRKAEFGIAWPSERKETKAEIPVGNVTAGLPVPKTAGATSQYFNEWDYAG